MFRDRSFQFPGIRTNDLLDLLAVLEQHERRHGLDAQLLRDIRNIVDVDLVEIGVVLVGEFFDLGRDHLAGAAPGGEAVEDGEAGVGGVGDFFGEGGFAGDVSDAWDAARGLW